MRRVSSILLALALLEGGGALADSVAQVSTAKRISRQTVTLIDPQGRPLDMGTTGTDTVVKVGDILTYVIQFTPVPNGAYRGLGGYITDYIPPGTEVVGARIVDRNGNTVRPHRGGLAEDGVGAQSNGFTAPLVPGSMSQLYADSGIFYSTDPLTRRRSTNPAVPANEQAFLTLSNGLVMTPSPSGVGNIAGLLGTSAPYYAHNEWDRIQYQAFGGGLVSTRGNTPEHVGNPGIGFGSPVAGPDTWYQLAARLKPGQTAATSSANVELFSVGNPAPNVGPWKRIRTFGAETGRRGAGNAPFPANPNNMPDPGIVTRVGWPATSDHTDSGTLSGVALSPDTPLPWSDPPVAGNHTFAVRYALGELVVGDEYYAELSLRVKKLPLDPGPYEGFPTGLDINCAEVAGGDASAREQVNPGSGKDHLWRYFLPAPTCVLLNLLFENAVDKILATANSTVTHTIDVKNLSTQTQTNVIVRDCFDTASQTLLNPPLACSGSPPMPVPCRDTAATGCPDAGSRDAIVWYIGNLMPGEARSFAPSFTSKGSGSNYAVYSSSTVPSFVATAYTTVAALAIMRLTLDATPAFVPAVPAVVHYTARATNIGTGAATLSGTCDGGPCMLQTTLPPGFTYKAGTIKVNGVANAANPTTAIVGGQQVVTWTPAAATTIAPGSTYTLEFDVDVAGTVGAGLYTSSLRSWVASAQSFEDAVTGVAPVAVLKPRSDPPTVTSPIVQGATAVTGTTAEAVGSTITVYVNGNPVGTVVTSGSTWSVTVPTLFAGQRITVTVTAPNELESLPSAPPLVVTGVGGQAACNDGKDNDGDGKCDAAGCTINMVALPADPGCANANDLDETDVPQCSDGLDNNGTGGIDFPNDPGCSSFLDNSESGGPACSNGVDDDGDGKMDFPNDPGCASAGDVNEDDVPACADGVDNDGDGKIDFPEDPGCSSALDDSEPDGSPANDDMSAVVGDGGLGSDGGVPSIRPDGAPPDPGGVGDADRGCGCTIGAAPHPGERFASLTLVAALALLVLARSHLRSKKVLLRGGLVARASRSCAAPRRSRSRG